MQQSCFFPAFLELSNVLTVEKFDEAAGIEIGVPSLLCKH